MEQTIDINAIPDQKLKQLKAILYLLQNSLEDIKDEVDRSYELLAVGEMTELAKKIEGDLTDPIPSMFTLSNDIDQNVKHILDVLVKSFFRHKKDILLKAFRSKTSLNDLHYSVILKNDNIENRNQIFDFFDRYDLMDISNKYPVYFQFVPIELMDKINSVEELKFD